MSIEFISLNKDDWALYKSEIIDIFHSSNQFFAGKPTRFLSEKAINENLTGHIVLAIDNERVIGCFKISYQSYIHSQYRITFCFKEDLTAEDRYKIMESMIFAFKSNRYIRTIIVEIPECDVVNLDMIRKFKSFVCEGILKPRYYTRGEFVGEVKYKWIIDAT